MRHDGVVLSYWTSMSIPRIDGLSTGPLKFRASHYMLHQNIIPF